MTHRQRWLIAILAVGALMAALALLSGWRQDALAVDGIIYVDADATDGDKNGTSWDDAFTDLQDALEAAGTGTQIWVAEGTYTPTQEFAEGDPRSATFQLRNGVALYGGFDPSVGDDAWEERDWDANLTILSGDLDGDDGPDLANNDENSYHVFYHPDGANLDGSAILDGFTVTGGNADGEGWAQFAGGGMFNYASSPTLNHCTFTSNQAGDGGGMYNVESNPGLSDCTFSGNSADDDGGGMENCPNSSPTLSNCSFVSNSAGGYGGGMDNWLSSSPILTNCTFSGNSAGMEGGGMSNNYSSPTLTNCTFTDNSAGIEGGGVYNYSYSSPTLINCILTGNSAIYGGGMYNYRHSSPTLTNCTFSGNSAANSGGAMRSLSDSSAVLVNCILWGDTPDEILSEDFSTPVVTYSDIQGGHEGEGNIDAAPLFLDPANGWYRLELGSPCIDTGDNTAPDLPPTDFMGRPRILDGDGDEVPVVDMGAHESFFGSPVYLLVVLRGS